MEKPRARGYKPGDNYIECQYTGFKIRASEAAGDYDGVYGRQQSIDAYRHPQEFAPTTMEAAPPRISFPKRYDNFVQDVTFIDDP